MQNEDIHKFIKQYYTTLATSITNISNFFAPSASLSITKEHENQVVITSNFDKHVMNVHNKGFSKILVSNYDIHKHGQVMLQVIGQYLYEDGENIRFVETILLDDKTQLINVSCVRLLDEEVVYDKITTTDSLKKYKDNTVGSFVKDPRKTLNVSNGAKFGIKEVVSAFKIFGKIVNYEKRSDESAFIEFDQFESLEAIKKNLSALKERGFELDLEKKYQREHNEKGHHDIKTMNKDTSEYRFMRREQNENNGNNEFRGKNKNYDENTESHFRNESVNRFS
ncbi:hypothetical protein EDEG_02579 [Edhazardia aedis USNM 41457]|uniref:NTF2 domain-containing protein n=1 Tax=Edhazardia aedis (strain USNM 41457) TaxID=1003232 RepID=J8ZTN7_EDHAE|nr:hypothetical protein EDEG_02579 [Edhazardia aedis USNM 41457]|eukprot:EJW03038.1 hypothetical protein EDEG_02579 [Edhazardia aedis USNM 41457]